MTQTIRITPNGSLMFRDPRPFGTGARKPAPWDSVAFHHCRRDPVDPGQAARLAPR